MAALLGQASIVIDQATLSPGVAARARNDGVLAQVVTLRNADNTNVKRWEWTLLRPRGSTAELSSLTAASVQFTPDVDGTYMLLLLVNEGKSAEQKSRSLFAVKSAGGYRFPAQGESAEANWTSAYTGLANETGWWEDITDILRANQAVFDGSILTVNTEANLGSSRRVVAGAGVIFTDGGAGGDFTIKLDPAASGVSALADVVGQAENLVATRVNAPSTRNAAKRGQVSIGAGSATSESYAAVLGGLSCTASALGATVGGGSSNTASGSYSFIGGGSGHSAVGDFSVINGGDTNTCDGDNTVVAGGSANRSLADQSAIGGGYSNLASGTAAVVGGGQSNTAAGSTSTIGGGYNNTTGLAYSTIGGGSTNQATQTGSTVSGGITHVASGTYATISGGQSNTVNVTHGSVGGGQSNVVSGAHGRIGGGLSNTVSSTYGTVGGGTGNSAAGNATCAGGNTNAASGTGSSVLGGASNTASGDYSSVSGGQSNTASGDYSSVLGGRSGLANASDAISMGRAAQASNTGAVVIKDGNSTAVVSSASHQLTKSFTGGIREFVVGGTWRRSAYSSTANYQETYQGMASTAGATTVNLDIIAIPTGQTVVMRGHIIGKKSTNSDAARRIYEGSFINVGGVITVMTALTDSIITNGGGNLYTATVGINSTNVRIAYAGVAATTVYWTWHFDFWFGGGP